MHRHIRLILADRYDKVGEERSTFKSLDLVRNFKIS